MTKDEGSSNAQMTKERGTSSRRHSDPVSSSSLPPGLIATNAGLKELLGKIQPAGRIAVDTEADSLHCYREKLCLVQISVPTAAGALHGESLTRGYNKGQSQNAAGTTASTPIGDAGSNRGADLNRDRRSLLQGDFIVDPLADVDLAPLRAALEGREIVLHGADFDLRMLRRGIKLVVHKIFDTVIAARLLGIREFSLAALVKRYFDVDLPKGSQKANWAQRPLSKRMAEYAINDTHYLLELAEKLEAELDQHHRLKWFHQSCQRALEQAAVERVRDEDEVWRVRGSGALRGRTAAVLRALWQWREKEAEAVDRPPFHILQNEELLRATESFIGGEVPDYRHFSERRRQGFRHAAERALESPEESWPVLRRGSGKRPTLETTRRADELRQRRDRAAKELKLEPAFVAPRSALERIAVDDKETAKLLVPWQRELLGV